MKCEEAIEQLVLQAYDDLSLEEQAELELHLHGCAACETERESISAFRMEMAGEAIPEVSPNLLTASRMRLDSALDEACESTWGMRLRAALLGTWQHVATAPALATFLVGMGFLSGSLLTRYQAAHASVPPHTGIYSPDSEGKVASISGIAQTSDPNVVQVSYNRTVPTTFTGRVDEPQLRQLLMRAAESGTDSDVRARSVILLANECKAGRCEHGKDAGDIGVRDALLVRLRYDKSPAVRLGALDGLQRYIGEDQKVRDAVLETLMRDKSADVRTHAIGMLEPVEGDSSVRQVLHTISTQDENPYIRNASMQALGTVDGIQ
jgi:hypothetical protein